MLRAMNRVLPSVLLLLASSTWAAPADQWTLTAEEWLRPRDGQRVLGFDALAAAVQAWDYSPGSAITIQYPGGDEGLLWATQLRDWLVALGVPSAAIHTAPGNDRVDALSITVSGGMARQ